MVYRIGVTPIRFALAGAELAGAQAVDGGRPLGLAFALGALLSAVFVLADPRWRVFGQRREEPPPPPAGADREEWWRSVLRSTLPSTVGLALLGAIALAFNSVLAAVLAGGLCGLGVAGLVVAVQVASAERALGGRLLFERGGIRGGLFLER